MVGVVIPTLLQQDVLWLGLVRFVSSRSGVHRQGVSWLAGRGFHHGAVTTEHIFIERERLSTITDHPGIFFLLFISVSSLPFSCNGVTRTVGILCIDSNYDDDLMEKGLSASDGYTTGLFRDFRVFLHFMERCSGAILSGCDYLDDRRSIPLNIMVSSRVLWSPRHLHR